MALQFHEPLPRHELMRRRLAREGWVSIVVGLLVPLIAADGAYRGFVMWRREGESAGLSMFLIGSAVFVARLALYAHSGFQHPF